MRPRLSASTSYIARSARIGIALACCTAAGIPANAAGGAAAYRKYEPHPVIVPNNASYTLPDGSINIVGDRTMEALLAQLNEIFVKTHPGIRFTMLTRDPPTGIDGIVAGVSIFAPVAHDAWEAEVEPLRRMTGLAALDFHIGRRGYVGAKRQNPPALYVNARNPLSALTLDEFGRILTMGRPPGDLRYWSQLGVSGAWAKHAIHVYGTRDDGKFITALRDAHFGGHPIARQYEAMPSDADVIEAVAGDRYGIGIAWFVDHAVVPKEVRILPLAAKAGDLASAANYDEVRRGAYLLSPYLHLYVRISEGQAVDPLVKEYIRLALSDEGQRLVANLKNHKESYVPLTVEESLNEWDKLEHSGK